MTTKLIEVVHSTYGIIKCTVEKSDYETLLFKRANGSLLAEMDKDSGGHVNHPSQEVERFLSLIGKDLVELDEDGYVRLEDLLFEEADELFPGFFNEAEDVPL